MRIARMTMDLDRILDLDYPKKFPNGAMHWVNDESIRACLEGMHFEDVSCDINKQGGEHNHAARIATLVTMIRSGVELHRIHIHITKRHLNFEDGNHRLRAFQFLGLTNNMRFYVTGRVDVLSMMAAPDYFHKRIRLHNVRGLVGRKDQK
jgi:hypothetical protein